MSICRSPFLIWFTGRTGSTFLCDLLNSHPQIHCRREDFSECHLNSGSGLSPRKIVEIKGRKFYRRIHRPDGFIEDPAPTSTLEYLKQIYSQNFDACGFKLKHPNQFIAFPEIVEQLHKMPTLKLIGLQRRNVVKQAVSLNNVKRIRAMGVVNSGNSKTSVRLDPIEVDVDETIKHARFFERCKSDLTSFAAPFEQFLRINYEDVIGNSEDTIQSLLEFLGVESDHVELHSNFKKITPDSLSGAVLNYDQLVDAIVGTDLEPYLE